MLGVVRISEIWEERGSIAAEASSQPSRGLGLQGGLSSFVDFVVGIFFWLLILEPLPDLRVTQTGLTAELLFLKVELTPRTPKYIYIYIFACIVQGHGEDCFFRCEFYVKTPASKCDVTEQQGRQVPW